MSGAGPPFSVLEEQDRSGKSPAKWSPLPRGTTGFQKQGQASDAITKESQEKDPEPSSSFWNNMVDFILLMPNATHLFLLVFINCQANGPHHDIFTHGHDHLSCPQLLIPTGPLPLP
jgi:hypothetical protein